MSKIRKELGAGNSVRSLHSKVDLHKNGYGNHSFLCNEDHEATNWGYYRVGTALAKTFSGFWATSKGQHTISWERLVDDKILINLLN